jgi:hypothetical protein
MVAGCLLLALRLGAAGEDSLPTEDDSGPPEGEIPILTSTDEAQNAPGYFQVTVNPLVTQRTITAAGVMNSANENVDAGWQVPASNLVTLGYDTGVNAFRQDPDIWDDEQANSLVTTAFYTKPSIVIQTGSAWQWTDYVQAQRSFTDDAPGFADSVKYGTQAAWTPIKDVTTVSADASTQETYNFNGSFLDENLYTGSLDQKLPYVPFTLHTAGSITDDSSPSPLMAAADRDNTIEDASLLWKVVTSTSCTLGVQRQDTTAPASLTLQNTNTYFTQVSVQASQSWTVTVGAAHNQNTATQAGQFLGAGSNDTLSFGLSWKLGNYFNAGAGISYRALQSETPAPAVSTPSATVSLSAGGSF